MLCIISISNTVAQPCPGNVDLQAASIDPGQPSILVGQTTQVYVVMQNNGPCDIPVGEATCQITLSSVYLDLGTPFNFTDICNPQWTYLGVISNATQHNLFFRNNAGPIPVGAACYFSFDIKGKLITPVNSAISLSSSLHGTALSSDIDPANQSNGTVINVTAPLPVKLESFAGTIKECDALLSWKTTSEENFERFDVEYSVDGRTFNKVGSVQGRNSPTGATYTFNYAQQASKAFYRLKLVDKDGKINFSGTVQLTSKCKVPTASLYPNPITAHQDGNVVLKNFGNIVYGYLYDAAGKQLQVIRLINGTNKVNLQKYASGSYVIKIKDESNNEVSLKITIAR